MERNFTEHNKTILNKLTTTTKFRQLKKVLQEKLFFLFCMFYTIFLGTLFLLRFWCFRVFVHLLVCFLLLLYLTVVWEALAKSENFMFNDIKNNLMRINNIMSTKFCSIPCYVFVVSFSFCLFVAKASFISALRKTGKIPSHKQLFLRNKTEKKNYSQSCVILFWTQEK